MKALLQPILLMVTALFLAGCSSYNPVVQDRPVTRLALAPVINESEIPRIIAPLSRNLREELQHAPEWRLVSGDEADAILEVRIVALDRDAVARVPEDTGRPLSYYETIRIVLEWNGSVPAPWGSAPRRSIQADSLLYAQPSLIESERAAVAELAAELAREIVLELRLPARPAQP